MILSRMARRLSLRQRRLSCSSIKMIVVLAAAGSCILAVSYLQTSSIIHIDEKIRRAQGVHPPQSQEEDSETGNHPFTAAAPAATRQKTNREESPATFTCRPLSSETRGYESNTQQRKLLVVFGEPRTGSTLLMHLIDQLNNNDNKFS